MKSIKDSQGFQYGYGVFETIKVYKGQALYLKDHYERLSKSLEVLKMPQVTYEDFYNAVEREKENKDHDVIKVICYLEASNTRITVLSRKSPYQEVDYIQGYQVKKSPYIRHSSNFLLQHKTLNYLLNIYEKKHNEDLTCDEWIHYNQDGFLTEGLYSNVFFVKDKCVFTPDVSNGLLAGIQRKNVLNTLKELGISFEIGYYKEEALFEADEVFFTNSILEIMPVSKYEGYVYDLNKNSITKILMEAFKNGLL